MSLAYTDPSKGLLLTLRILSLSFSQAPEATTLSFEVKLGKLLWLTSRNQSNPTKFIWSLSHTFELPELSSLSFRVFHKSGFFREIDLGSCVIGLDTFTSRKGVRITEIFTKDHLRIRIVWGFVIEEGRKGDGEDYLRMINEVEAEREEVRFYRNRLSEKLRRVKEKRRFCKGQIQRLFMNVGGSTEELIGAKVRVTHKSSESIKLRTQKDLHEFEGINRNHQL